MNNQEKLGEISLNLNKITPEIEGLINRIGQIEFEYNEAKRIRAALKQKLYEKCEFVDSNTEHFENDDFEIKISKSIKKEYDKKGILKLKEKFPEYFKKLFKEDMKYKPDNKAIDVVLSFGGEMADEIAKIRTERETSTLKVEDIRDEGF